MDIEKFKGILNKAVVNVVRQCEVEEQPAAWAGMALGLKVTSEALNDNETAMRMLQSWAVGDFKNDVAREAFASVLECYVPNDKAGD